MDLFAHNNKLYLDLILSHGSCVCVLLHDKVNLMYFMFCCFPVIFAAFVSIHLQPFHRMRHLVGLLCGVMVTQRPQASRTSEFSAVNDKKNETKKTTAITLFE